METPHLNYAIQCLAEAAVTMSTAAEALALAAQAFSSASAELVNLCNFSDLIENIDHGVPLEKPNDHQSQLNAGCSGAGIEQDAVRRESCSNTTGHDYYFPDDDNDTCITALLKRQQSPEHEVERGSSLHQLLRSTLAEAPTPVLLDPQLEVASTPKPTTSFERHLLVDLETDVIPTVCALTERFSKVICYMQCALPSIMIYHRIIKQITRCTVYAITRPNMSQSDNTWGAFNRQGKVIILLPETLTSSTPLRAVGDICVIHVGWPSSAQSYRSQLALHDAPCSVLVACIQDRQIFPSSEELISETAPWPAEDKQLLGNQVSHLFPKFEAALAGIPRATKDTFYQDWIEVHGPRGHRYVSTWDAITLVNRANLYICDVLGYNSSNKDWSLPRTPPVSHAFVSRNGLEPAADKGVLILVEGDSRSNQPVDLSKDTNPRNKPISTAVPEVALPEATPQTEKPTINELDNQEESNRKKKDPTNLAPGQTLPPGASLPELRRDSSPVHSTTSTNNIRSDTTGDKNKPEPESDQAPTQTDEYFLIPEDFHMIPAICMLAKDGTSKNIICYVQIVGVMQTLITQIHALTSKPIFIVASPNSAALPKALKAFESPTGGIVFCNYLLPLCQPLRSKSVHRIIHAGWTGKLDLYSQQINATRNTSNYMIVTQSQYSGISDPGVTFGASQLNMARKVFDSVTFGAMVSKWENQLNHAPEKALNGCYMEWIAYHGKGQNKVDTWSIVELVSQANIFGEKVLRRKGNPSTLAASEG
ncbi:unnamed protein product, partial [Rhizoctonia solani]